MQAWSRLATTFFLGTMLLASFGRTSAQIVTPLPSVDLDRFTGTWYEIARLPNKREKKCIADVVEVLALGDKAHQLQIVGSCKTNKGYTEVRNASAKGLKNSGNAKLKVSYLWPFSEKRWVLALGQNNEWALVGSPNRKTLWVLSRTRTMKSDVLATIEQQASSQGFEVSKLTMTAQTGS